MRKRDLLLMSLVLILLCPPLSLAGEVFKEPVEISAEGIDHSKNQLLIVGTRPGGPSRYKLPEQHDIRPNYKLLDPNVKSGEIPYGGPTSSRTKVYLLAGGLAAGGILGAAALPVAAASAAPSAAGAAGLGVGAGVVATGTGAIAYTYKTNSEQVNTTQISGAKSTEINEKADL